MNSKIKLVSVTQNPQQNLQQNPPQNPPSKPSGGIKINSSDFPIIPERQPFFSSLYEQVIFDINNNENEYNLSPVINGNQVNCQSWEFSFKGQGNFNGRKISGVLKFPADFPNTAPLFYFYPLINGEVIQHVNIYGDHKLCIPLLSHWQSSTTALEILQAIEHIFHNPNWGQGDAPANPNFNYLMTNENPALVAQANAEQVRQAGLMESFSKE